MNPPSTTSPISSHWKSTRSWLQVNWAGIILVITQVLLLTVFILSIYQAVMTNLLPQEWTAIEYRTLWVWIVILSPVLELLAWALMLKQVRNNMHSLVVLYDWLALAVANFFLIVLVFTVGSIFFAWANLPVWATVLSSLALSCGTSYFINRQQRRSFKRERERILKDGPPARRYFGR